MSDKTFAEAMGDLEQATISVVLAVRDELQPVIERLAFELQRSLVEYVNDGRWWQHWRLRWQLRRARRWSK